MSDHQTIQMGHGAGGRLTDELIREVFVQRLSNEVLDRLGDSATFPAPGERLAFTTDGFVVSPRTFPGGDLGSIAVNGTVNDLAVAGAIPRYLTLSVILEEGMEVAELARLVESAADAAKEAGVAIVAGDTKVVGKGAGDGAFFVTAGIGALRDGYEPSRPEPGDEVLVSGPVGDHGATILALRMGMDPGPGLASDCGSVLPAVDALFAAGIEPRFMRDPTRGGLAATLAELAESMGLEVAVDEERIPVRQEVAAVCDLLGVDPLHLACEGRVVAVVPAGRGEAALAALGATDVARDAAIIGRVSGRSDRPRAVLRTALGGLRVIDRPASHPLPRIC